MIAIVAPEPVSWLEPVVEACGRAGRVVVFAPWAMAPVRVPLPAPVVTFVARRRAPSGARLRHVPMWPLAEGLARGWAGARTDRTLRLRFAIRRAVDHLAAAWLLRQRELRAVVAPSCAAQRTFAAAARSGAATILVEDLPDLRWLHRDLDAAARAHPGCHFLRRYRAPDPIVARQRCERVLATHILVRGRLARRRLAADGIASETIGPLPEPTQAQADTLAPAVAAPPRRTRVVLLAGLAAARHGTVETLAALEHLPDVELLVRVGEGLEPEAMLRHPRVRPVDRAQLDTLTGIDAVIAPAWCETYLPELARAAAAGIPIVATTAAAGFLDLERLGATIPPGDPAALARALDGVLTRGRRPPAPPAPSAAAEALASVLLRGGVAEAERAATARAHSAALDLSGRRSR